MGFHALSELMVIGGGNRCHQAPREGLENGTPFPVIVGDLGGRPSLYLFL